MSDKPAPIDLDSEETIRVLSLKAAIAAVKTRQADETDVIVEMKEAERARLDLLAQDIMPLLDEIDPRDERFDFCVVNGERPRLWIDMTTFVAMGVHGSGGVKNGYRLLKDTRMGRIVLLETADRNAMADAIATYVAERVLERERALEGDWLALSPERYQVREEKEEPPKAFASGATVKNTSQWQVFLLLGALMAVALTGFGLFTL